MSQRTISIEGKVRDLPFDEEQYLKFIKKYKEQNYPNITDKLTAAAYAMGTDDYDTPDAEDCLRYGLMLGLYLSGLQYES